MPGNAEALPGHAQCGGVRAGPGRYGAEMGKGSGAVPQLRFDAVGFDVEAAEDARDQAPFDTPTDRRHGHHQITVEVADGGGPGRVQGEGGVAVEALGLTFGFEVQGAGGGGRVDTQLLDPGEMIGADQALCHRIKVPGEFVAESENSPAVVHVVAEQVRSVHIG